MDLTISRLKSEITLTITKGFNEKFYTMSCKINVNQNIFKVLHWLKVQAESAGLFWYT